MTEQINGQQAAAHESQGSKNGTSGKQGDTANAMPAGAAAAESRTHAYQKAADHDQGKRIVLSQIDGFRIQPLPDGGTQQQAAEECQTPMPIESAGCQQAAHDAADAGDAAVKPE